MSEIVARRLHAQRLIGRPFASAVEAVRWLGAVQSQDYIGAKWALAQRCAQTTDAELDRLFDEGAILRTHVMRPTWHFALPEDIRWLLELTGPRVRAGIAGRYRQLELDDQVVGRAHKVFVKALRGGRYMTRPELGDVLRKAGIAPDGQRLPHLIASAELAGLVISGPRRGKQFTFALFEERAPGARRLGRDEAVRELTLRYFKSHGPAQLQDFAWWSGLTMADARSSVALAGDALEQMHLDGKDYWLDSAAGAIPTVPAVAHLLPNFDEYTVAYRDRMALIHPDHPFDAAMFSFGSILANVVTIGGHLRGAWRRTTSGKAMEVQVTPLTRFTPDETAAIGKAVERMGRYLERPIQFEVVVKP